MTNKKKVDESKDSSKSKTHRVTSLNEFMKWVEGLPLGEYVYRGVSNKDYLIEPSTYRRLKNEKGESRSETNKTPETLRRLNSELIEDANRHRHGWENDKPSDLDLLAKLQHNGAATCLIDFTKSSLVALWMACKESSKGSVDGKVYVVDIGFGSPFKLVSFDESQKESIDYFFQQDERTGYQLYRWQPHYQEGRRLAQQSIFLFGGGWNAIEAPEECIIAKQDKKQILESLKRVAGISENILFPDFEGFASQHAENKAYSPLNNLTGVDSDRSSQAGSKETDDNESQRLSFARSYLELSLQAYQEGNTEFADGCYYVAMQIEPADEDLNSFYRNRAIFFISQDNFESAIDDYDEAIRLGPNDDGSYFGRGRAKFSLEKYEESIADFGEAIAINPKADYYYWRGLAKYNHKDPHAAILDFDRAIRKHRLKGHFHYWRGMARFKIHDRDGGIPDFDEAILLNPRDSYSYLARGLAKYDRGEYPAAERDFDTAIDLNTADGHRAHSHYWRGLSKKAMSRIEGAKKDFELAMEYAEEAKDSKLQDEIRQAIQELRDID